MVLINELTVEQINAALLHLQRSKDEVVGGNKGTTIQNITISNSGGGGNNVDYSGTIKNLATNIEKNKTAIEKNASDIAKLKSDMANIEKSVEDTLQGLVDNGISDLSYDPLTKQLTITTNDGDIYQAIIEQDIGYLSYDSATNKLILTTGNQSQEITLPYILSSEKGSANGVATLDENGRVPYSQLPESAMEFLGQWNASTNTPHLQDGTGTNGDFYVCNVGGTVTFGTGNTQTFVPNDRVIYNGTSSQWVKLPAGQVSSVNGMSGDVTLTASNIEYSTGVTIKQQIDANAPVQSDWNVTDTTSLAYIKNKPSIAVLGNTVGCALGTASAGSCTTAARSDHVHPIPHCVRTSSDLSVDWFVFTRWNICSDSRYYADISNTCAGTSRYGIRVAYANEATTSCCAKCVFLDSFSSSADRPIMIACPRGTTGYSDQGVSTVCPLTYNPATGTMCRNGGEMAGFQVAVGHANNTRRYLLVDYGSAHGGNVTVQIYNSVYSVNKADSATSVVTTGDGYGALQYAHLGTGGSASTCGWLSFTGWSPLTIFGRNPIKIVSNTTTAPSGVTFYSACNYRYPNMNDVANAADVSVAQNTVCRKIIMTNTITNSGYRTRVGIGLQRSTDDWGVALLSVGTNDAGTTFYDYKFSNTGVLTAACFCGTATSSNYLSTYAANGSDNISSLKAIFNTAPKSVGTAVRLQHSTHSMAFGWFLDGYACANAYGGWFVSDYNIPRFVGISNGTWEECTIITSGTIGSQHVACADHASSASVADSASMVGGGRLVCSCCGSIICQIMPHLYYAEICACKILQCDLYKFFRGVITTCASSTYWTQTSSGRWETSFSGMITGRESGGGTICSLWCDLAVLYINNSTLRFYNNDDSVELEVACSCNAWITTFADCKNVCGYFVM